MEQVLDSWNSLLPQKKVVVVLAIIATLVTFFGLARLVNTPNMSLLYSGLDSATSGEIVGSLEQKAIPFEIRGDAIYVDSTQRDRARLTLAGEGLPSNGIAGYELLDSLSGFGTTSQMFDAAYWRAKEGELARTILASARISKARVHIANPVQQPFSRGVEPTASVTISMKNGTLDAKQATAIRYLVAAAVSGMAPEQVAVIDSEYGIILESGQSSSTRSGTGALDPRAEELRENIERLLSARVGVGNVVVEVMVQAHNERETVTQRVLDPENSVPISSDNETSTESSSGGVSGAVTVASNLPDTGDSAGGGQNSQNKSLSRERVNYEISETVRERVLLPGDIARLSVAVLINFEATEVLNGGTTYAPRTEAELAAFQALVKSIVGFDASRGDVVTIESLQFPEAKELGTTASAGLLSGYSLDIPAMMQMAVLAVVTLVLGLFVVRPILTNPAPQLPVLDTLPELGDFGQSMMPDELPELPAFNAVEKDPIEILRDAIALRSEESGHLLRNWIETDAADEKGPALS